MMEDIYRALAARLDMIPSGFPSTDSGVELELLARLFTPAEAALASVMRLTPESAIDIAARAAVDAHTAADLLNGMARRDLVRAEQEGDRPTFALARRLGPGFPGTELLRRDAELARLAEEYYRETRGISLEHAPASMRVIPVQQAIPIDLQIHPSEQASTLLENAKSWGVRNCLCRVGQRAIDKNCGHPLEVCLLFSPLEGDFEDSELDRAISKEEALRILHQAEEAGLVHTTMNLSDQPFNICNCCTCSCAILRGVAEFGIPTAVAHSDFRASVQVDLCDACGACIERCQFGALSVGEGIATVDHGRCVGCGVCASACPTNALGLERRPAGESLPIPADVDDWMARFAKGRGMPLADVL